MNFEHGIDILESPRQIVWKSSFLHKQSRHNALIMDHHFNHSMQLMLPFQSTQQKHALTKILKDEVLDKGDAYFYHVVRVNAINVHHFVDMIGDAIEKDFIVRALVVNGLVDPVKIAVCDKSWIMHINEKMIHRFGMTNTKIRSFFDRDVWRVTVPLKHGNGSSMRKATSRTQTNTIQDHPSNETMEKNNTIERNDTNTTTETSKSNDLKEKDILSTIPVESNMMQDENDIEHKTDAMEVEESDPSYGHIPRLKWVLKRWLEEENLQIDFVVSIENQNGDPVDLGLFTTHNFPKKKIKGFGKSLNLSLPKNLLLPKVRSTILTHNTEADKKKWDATIKALTHYLGIVSTGSHNYLRTNNLDRKYDDAFFVHNVYGPFNEYQQFKGGLYLNISGFVSPIIVKNTLQVLRDYYKTQNEELWYSILVTGFENSPISWRQYNHGSCIGSENDYIFINLAGEDQCYVSVQCINEYGGEIF